MIAKDILHLEESHARNYIALQNFLNGVVVKRGKHRGYVRNKKRLDSKARSLMQQGCMCADCQKVFTPDSNGEYSKATADHVIPRRHGSTFALNTEWVCQKCNHKREDNRMYHILRYFGTIE